MTTCLILIKTYPSFCYSNREYARKCKILIFMRSLEVRTLFKAHYLNLLKILEKKNFSKIVNKINLILNKMNQKGMRNFPETSILI
jgi:hypothetical protein